MHAVILAGGKGTRLRPLTDTRPKPLLPFAGDPFAAGLLRRLAAAGGRDATFLVGVDEAPFAPLRDLGEQLGIPVEVVTEPEPLDTAGAARDLLRGRDDGPFLVCNGDILTDLDYAGLLAVHAEAGAVVTLALTRVTDTSTFGVVETDAGGRVQRFVEKPPAGTIAADTINAGTYVLSPEAFADVAASGPLSFERAVFPSLVDQGAIVLGVASDAFWMDLGTPDRYLGGQRAVLSGDCAWPLGEAFDRDGPVLRHRDATIHPTATLQPFCVVGAGATIEAGAVLANAAVFEDATVGAGAQVRSAIVGEAATIPSGTTLPEGAVVAPNSVWNAGS